MKEFKIRCSSIYKIMGSMKKSTLTDKQVIELKELEDKRVSKGVEDLSDLDSEERYALTEKQNEKRLSLIEKRDRKPEISSGAKSYCEEWLMSNLVGYKKEVKSKYLEKGLACEDDAILLLNPDYRKNEERRESNYLSGECDILLDDKVIDIKCSWDFSTFPKLKEVIPDEAYIWQVQGYMILENKPKAEVSYCLMNTPEHLDDRCLDYSHLPRELRIKTFYFERDESAYEQIIEAVELCREYIEELKYKFDLREVF